MYEIAACLSLPNFHVDVPIEDVCYVFPPVARAAASRIIRKGWEGAG